MTLTDEWVECFEHSKANGECLAESAFWRLSVSVLPLGVNPRDPRVQAAIKEIQASSEESKP